MQQISDWLGRVPAVEDYMLRGVFPWLDDFNDWINASWLGGPVPMWLGIAILVSALGAAYRRR
jgi:hypothetical protein